MKNLVTLLGSLSTLALSQAAALGEPLGLLAAADLRISPFGAARSSTRQPSFTPVYVTGAPVLAGDVLKLRAHVGVSVDGLKPALASLRIVVNGQVVGATVSESTWQHCRNDADCDGPHHMPLVVDALVKATRAEHLNIEAQVSFVNARETIPARLDLGDGGYGHLMIEHFRAGGAPLRSYRDGTATGVTVFGTAPYQFSEVAFAEENVAAGETIVLYSRASSRFQDLFEMQGQTLWCGDDKVAPWATANNWRESPLISMSVAGLHKVVKPSQLRCRVNVHGAFGRGADLVADESYLQQFVYGAAQSGRYLVESDNQVVTGALVLPLGPRERTLAEKVLELKAGDLVALSGNLTVGTVTGANTAECALSLAAQEWLGSGVFKKSVARRHWTAKSANVALHNELVFEATAPGRYRMGLLANCQGPRGTASLLDRQLMWRVFR